MREPVKFGSYYLFERVAVGGMAEVFKGVSYGVEGFERLFAVKRVLPNISEDQEFIEMFIDEAKIAVQLTHANIGQIFELGNADDSYFIAMEFVQGKDLRAIFDRARNRGSKLDIAMCCHIVKEVCEALEYAHNKRNERQEPLNLIHRDVSPQNIIVSYDGEVKLIDFGIAKAAGKASKTQAGILKGKFGYMSPEQVRGKPIDRRSDLFSLAVVLYEVLTQERCFQGESDFSTLEKVRNVDIRRPATVNREIPPELERIVLRGLSRNPQERYQSAAEFQDALQKYLYQSGAFYARKDLAAYMRETFDRELHEEARRLSEFRDYARANIPEARRVSSIPDVKPVKEEAPFKPDLPALSWEEDELETAVWDRDVDDVPIDTIPAPPDPDPPAFAAAAIPPMDAPTVDVDSVPINAPVPAFTHPIDHGPRPADVVLPPETYEPRGSNTSTRVLALIVVALLAGLAAVIALKFWDRAPPVAHLIVKSTPNLVTVYVDGQVAYEGATPATLPDLTPGSHEIKVEADGHLPMAQRLEFAEGEHKQLEVELPASQVLASLELETIPPGAKVYIDDKLVDETPLKTGQVTPGQRKLRIEKQGFQTWQGTVTATAGRPTKVKPIELLPTHVTVTFLPEPNEARISVVQPDGKRMVLGTGPQNYTGLDNRGNVRVVVELEGYETLEKRLPKYSSASARELLTLTESAKKPVATPTPTPPRPRDPPPVRPRKPKDPDDECEGEDCPGKPKVVRVSPPPEKPDPPEKPESKDPGFLNLIAKPAARAFIAGKDVGWTPIIKHKLPAGNHQITLVRSEEPAYRTTVSVVIAPGETTLRKYNHK